MAVSILFACNKLKPCITNTHTYTQWRKKIVVFRQSTKLRMINTIKTSVKTVPMINLYCSFMFRTNTFMAFFLLCALSNSSRVLVWLFVSIHLPYVYCFVSFIYLFFISCFKFLEFAFEKASPSKATAYYFRCRCSLYSSIVRTRTHTLTYVFK